MQYLYHGSPVKGLKRLEPRKSTHGTYVYATPFKELSIIFSGKYGDDMTSTLYRMDQDGPWKLVERIPHGFDTMFNNDASLYTLESTTFKDINTGFAEVVSDQGVDVISEEYIENVYTAVENLAREGKIELYTYPNRPEEIPQDDSDLIEKVVAHSKRSGEPLTKSSFARLLFLHPNLLDQVNLRIQELGLDIGFISQDDLLYLYDLYLERAAAEPDKEFFLSSAITTLSEIYPDVANIVKERCTQLGLNINTFTKEI